MQSYPRSNFGVTFDTNGTRFVFAILPNERVFVS